VLVSLLLPLIVVGVFLDDPPAGQRLVIIAPFLCVTTAIGLNFLYNLKMHSRFKKLPIVLVSYFIVLIATFDVFNYFFMYIPERNYGGLNGIVVTEMSRYLKNSPEGTVVHFYGAPRIWFYGFSNFYFVTPQVKGIDVKSFSRVKGYSSRSEIIYIALPENKISLENLSNDLGNREIWMTCYFQPVTISQRMSYYFGQRERSWIKHLPALANSKNTDCIPLFYFIDFTNSPISSV